MQFGLIKMGCSEESSVESSAEHDVPCNGRGECVVGPKGNETCICEIKFTGDFCSNFNKTYHAGTTLTYEKKNLINIH